MVALTPRHASRLAPWLLALVLVLLGLGIQPAHATNSYTKPGLRTSGCAVSWYAQTDLSHSYTKDYNGNGTMENGEIYSNQGYLYQVSSRNDFPAVHGPGDFTLQHWTNNDTSLGFRLPLATDHPMYDVTVTIKPDSANLKLGQDLGTMGLDRYVLFDGNPAYTVAAPAPTVTYVDGTIKLHFATLPAKSANVFGFSGTALDGKATDPASHYLISATLRATYAEGAGCEPTVPPVPKPPAAGPCEQVVTGRTTWPLGAPDITERIKSGEGGEVNADGFPVGSTLYLRLYGATDRTTTNVTATFTAAQGFTFAAVPDPIATGSVPGMGGLTGAGYTEPVSGPGTPTLSDDGKTITITVATMPAKSAFAMAVKVVPDGSYRQFVLDSVMRGTLEGCDPNSTPTPKPTPRPSEPAKVLGPIVQTDAVADDPANALVFCGTVLTAIGAAGVGRRRRR